MDATTTPTRWGPLAEPIHLDAGGAGDPPWRDNAYAAFWSAGQRVFGSLHVSTSPNAEGRRARFSVAVDDGMVEVVEALEPGSFASPSITFDLDGRITVATAGLAVDLLLAPRFVPADYTPGEALPALIPGAPLRHYQQGAEVTGTITLEGHPVPFAGQGMRDRTWGFRDESAQWVEYAGVIGCCETFDLTVMKCMGNDGQVRVDGCFLSSEGSEAVTAVRFTRDPAGLFARATLTAETGKERTVTMSRRLGGFWVPMGVEREGPAFSAYDEFFEFDVDGAPGQGFAEQGILRRVW